MKNQGRILLLIAVVISLGSCSVSRNNKKLIVGNWQYEKMGRFVSDNQGQDPRWDTLSDHQSLVEFKKKSEEGGKEQILALSEAMFMGMSFRPDKSITFKTRKKECYGTWKISGFGKKLTVKDTSASKTYTLQIIAIDSARFTAGFAVKDGKLQRVYKRLDQ
jgi:hypothetical protein